MKLRSRSCAVLLLVLAAHAIQAQVLVSVAFDPPKTLQLGALDTLASPQLHKEHRGLSLNVDLDSVADIGFKMAFAIEISSWGLPEGEHRHRMASNTVHVGTGTGWPRRVLTRDSLETGSFTLTADSLWNLDYTSTGATGIQYIPFAKPEGSGLRYGWMRVLWDGNLFRFYGWQLQDSLDLIDNLGAAPTVRAQHAAAAFAVHANDIGEQGSAADLQIGFRHTPAETGVSEYRIMVVPPSISDTFDRGDALAIPAGRYRVHLPDATDPVLSYTPADVDVLGQPIVQNLTYRIVILSMPDGVDANQPSLTIGCPIQLRVRANAPRNVVLQDSLDLVQQTDLFIRFEPPQWESNIAGYWCALERLPAEYEEEVEAPDYVGLDADSILGLAADRRFFIPADGSTAYTAQLPAGLKDTRGASFKPSASYRGVVASEALPGLADYAFAEQSAWVRLGFPSRTPEDFALDGDGNHLDGRLLRAGFQAPADELGISEYRLYAVESAPPVPASSLIGLDSLRYASIVPDGSAAYRIDWAGKTTISGVPIVLDQLYEAYLLVLGDTAIMNGFVLLEHPILRSGNIDGCLPESPSLVSTASTGSPSDFILNQELPLDTVGMQSMHFVFVPVDSMLTAEAMLALPPGHYLERSGDALSGPLPAGVLDAYGNPINLGELYYVQSQFFPDGTDASVYPVSEPSSPFFLSLNSSSATALTAVDAGASGTGRDLKIAFGPAPDESSISHYRVVVQADSSSIPVDAIETAAIGRFIDLPTGSAGFALSAAAIKQLDGQPIGAAMPYRVVVASMDASGGLVGRRDVVMLLTDAELLVQAAEWEDVGDFRNPLDFGLSFDTPDWTDSLAAYHILIYPDSMEVSLDVLLAAAPAEVFDLPVTPLGINTLLPASLLSLDGNPLVENAHYHIAVISEVVLEDTMRFVWTGTPAHPYRFTEWPVKNVETTTFSGNLGIDFTSAADQRYLTEYRLICTGPWLELSLEEALAVPVGSYTVLDLTAVDSAWTYYSVAPDVPDINGIPVNDGVLRRAHILSFAGPGYGSLVASDDLFSFGTVGISPPANPAFSLATAPGHWLLSADLPLEAVEVFDALGRKRYAATPGTLQQRIPTDRWAAGTYVVRVLVQDRWHARRMTIAR